MTRPVPPPGIVVVDKPAGMTSHDVVGRCRRIFGTRKVGHAGTLDPLARGVLLVCTGTATRAVEHFMDLEKEYEFDGYDWRNATEEGSMAICPVSGELLHPAHL